jgi:phosphatidylinositol transfer protein SFH5
MRSVDSGEPDYQGVTLSSRTVNSKAAASTITDLFQKHYPEFLVRVALSSFPTSQ